MQIYEKSVFQFQLNLYFSLVKKHKIQLLFPAKELLLELSNHKYCSSRAPAWNKTKLHFFYVHFLPNYILKDFLTHFYNWSNNLRPL